MSSWNTQTIAELGKIVTGKTPPSAKPEQFGDEFPFVTPSDIQFGNKHTTTERFLSERGVEAHKRILLPKKTICVVCIGATIGKVCVTDQISISNQQINSIIVDSKKHDPDFVYYITSLLRSTLEAYAGGAATPIVNKGAFSKLKLQVPERDVQRKIAAVLTAYDDLIETNKHRIALLEKMTEELYYEWFVRMRFPGHQDTKFVKGVPEGWKVEHLRNVIDFLEGPGLRNWQYTNTDEGTRFINIRCIQNGDINLSACNRVASNEAFGRYQHFLLSEGDIVVSTSGTLGRFTVIREEHLPLMLNTSVIRMRPISGNLTFEFLIGYIATGLQVELEMRASGAAQKNFGPMHLNQIKLMVPSADLLARHSQLASPLFEQLQKLRISIRNLTQTRDLLLPRLIAGKLSVEDLDIQFPSSMQEDVIEPKPTKQRTHG